MAAECRLATVIICFCFNANVMVFCV